MNGVYCIGLVLAVLQALSTTHGQACDISPCNNGALCEERGEGYSCFCVDGFTGPTCAINFDDCLSSPCRNNATCIDGVANYTCACAQGFTGPECQGDIDECISSPCLRNGTCINVVNGYVCACVEPYRGDVCDLLPCETTNPCEQDAECTNDERSLVGFICDCPVGYSGDRCEVDISDCTLVDDPCSGNGLCVDGVSEYSCLCEPGWAGDKCHAPIDDCIDNACRNDANCTDLHLGYFCECHDGYDGALCERERDECETFRPCQNGADCIDLFDDYLCDCGSGWHGTNCTEPVNECLTSPCLNGATCLDHVGREFTCRCAPFFTGSLCETQFNPCAPEYSPCQNNANCLAPPDGQYRCFCETGYTGIHCEVDINECLLQPCENNSTCEDITAGYVCHCMQGWTGSVCEQNVDDCAAQPCYNDAACLDLLNSFECVCPLEYTGRHCDQTMQFCNEDSCLNGGTCINVLGGFECACPQSYTGDTCNNTIDACKSDPCVNNATCLNTNNGADCVCDYPYTGRTCDDTVDLCESDPCLNGGTCLRLATGYLCVCPQFLTGRQCTDLIDYCGDEPCKNGAYCINDAARYRCSCLYGFTGLNCTEMVDFCIDGPCQNEANCSNIPGGFRCDCEDGFDGSLCQNVVVVPSSTSLSLSYFTALYSNSIVSVTRTIISTTTPSTLELTGSSLSLTMLVSFSSETHHTIVPSSTLISLLFSTSSQDTTIFMSDIQPVLTMSPSLYTATGYIVSNQGSFSEHHTLQPSSNSFMTTISTESHTKLSVVSTQISDMPIATIVPSTTASEYLTSHEYRDSISVTSVKEANSLSFVHTRQSTTPFTSLHLLTSLSWDENTHSSTLPITSAISQTSTVSSVASPLTSKYRVQSDYEKTGDLTSQSSTSTYMSENSDVLITSLNTLTTSSSIYDDSSTIQLTVSLHSSRLAPTSSTQPFIFPMSSMSSYLLESTLNNSTFTSAISNSFHSSQVYTLKSLSYSSSASYLEPSTLIESHATISGLYSTTLSTNTPFLSNNITHVTTYQSHQPTLEYSSISASDTTSKYSTSPLYTGVNRKSLDSTTYGKASSTFAITSSSTSELHGSHSTAFVSSSLSASSSTAIYETKFAQSTVVFHTNANSYQSISSDWESSQISTTMRFPQSSTSLAYSLSQGNTSLLKSEISLFTNSTSLLPVRPTLTSSNVLITTESIISIPQSTSQYMTSVYKSADMDSFAVSVSTQGVSLTEELSPRFTFTHTKPLYPLTTSIHNQIDVSTMSMDMSFSSISSNTRSYTSSTSFKSLFEYSIGTLTDKTITTMTQFSKPASPSLSNTSPTTEMYFTTASVRTTLLKSSESTHVRTAFPVTPSAFPSTLESVSSSLQPSYKSPIKSTSRFPTTQLRTSNRHTSSAYDSSTYTTTTPAVLTSLETVSDSTGFSVVSKMSYTQGLSSLGSFQDSATMTMSWTSSEVKSLTFKAPSSIPLFDTTLDSETLTLSLTTFEAVSSTFDSHLPTTPMIDTLSSSLSGIAPITTTTSAHQDKHTTTTVSSSSQISTFSSPVSSIPVASSSSLPIASTTTTLTSTPLSPLSSSTTTTTPTSSSLPIYLTTTPTSTPSSQSPSIPSSTTTTTTTTTTTRPEITTTATPNTTPSDIGCVGIPCLNNGTCRADRVGDYCDCLGGFIGRSCETETSVCQTFVCENGGQCTVSMTTYGTQVPTCNCPLPFTGTRCHKESLVYFPSFLGTSYLEFQPPIFTNEQTNEINIAIKTTATSGTILYSSNQHQARDDSILQSSNQQQGRRVNSSFIRLGLDGGKLVYEFSCDGHMEGVVVGHNYVNTGDIYDVTIRQVWPSGAGHWCSASLTVNDVTSVSRPLLALSAAAELGNLYIGGIPRRSYTNEDQPRVHVMDGYVGCVRSLQVNRREIDVVSMATGSVNIENCNVPVCQHSPCKHGGTCHSVGDDWYCDCLHGYAGRLCERRLCHTDPCKHGGTCVILEEEKDQLCMCPYGRGGVLCETALSIDTPHYTGTRFGHTSFTAYAHPSDLTGIFEAEFRLILDENSTNSNLVLFMGNTDMRLGNQDFLAVGLYRGYLVFRFDLGSGYGEVYSPAPLNQSLPHHVVALGRTGTRCWLQVDDQRNMTSRSRGPLTALNTRSMLYVGGYPNDDFEAIAEPATFENGLKGCLYQLRIRTYGHNFIEPGSPPGHVEEGRNVAPCTAVACEGNPCHNGAECVDLGASIYCNCTDGWKGALCLDETTVCDVISVCAHGSTCVPVTPASYTCMCPLGKRGKHCDEDFEISDPLFTDEDSYMSLEPVYIRRHADIIVQLTSYKSDGLIFYVSKRLHSVSGDFLSLSLDDWKLQLRFDVGSGLNVVRSDISLENGTWYTVYAGRNSTHGYVSVNSHVTIAMTSGMMSYLDTTTNFFIGGIPHLSDAASRAFENEPSGLHGCIRELVVNGRMYDLTQSGAVSGRNIGDCDGTSCGYSVCKNGGSCTSGVGVNVTCVCPDAFFGERCEIPVQCRNHECLHGDCRVIGAESHVCYCRVGWTGQFCDQAHVISTSARLAGNGYLVLTDRKYVTRNTSHTRLALTFKSRALNTLFVWHGQTYTDDEDYLGVGLHSGHVKVAWNLGWYSSNDVVTTLRYNDGEWHKLSIEIIARDLFLTIDGAIYTSIVSGDFRELDTYGIYYIGGFENGNVIESTLEFFTAPLDGCIKDLRLHNDSAVVFDDVDVGVNVIGCI